MAVTTVTTHWRGATGSLRGENRSVLTGNFDTLHIVQTNDALDQVNTILKHFENDSSLPYPGRTLNYGNDRNSDMVCIGLTPVKRAESRFIWDVTANFATRNLNRWPTGSPSNNGSPSGEDTLGDEYLPTEIDVQSTQITVPVEEAIYQGGMIGQAHQMKSEVDFRIGPITNSAFTPYDTPVEKEMDIRIVRITRSYSGWLWTAAEQYRGGVNDNDFDPSFHGLGYIDFWGAYKARLKDVSGTMAKTRSGELYWRISWEFWINPLTWRAQVLDRGLYRLAMKGYYNGRGGTYTEGDIVNGMPNQDRILDPQGIGATEPVLLDGNGQPIRLPGGRPVYLTYSIYAEVNYQGLFNVIRNGV